MGTKEGGERKINKKRILYKLPKILAIPQSMSTQQFVAGVFSEAEKEQIMLLNKEQIEEII